MSEVEYIVSLKRGVDADAFNQEMIASSGAAAIPNRTVDIADARELSVRLTHYSLTAAEAESLKADSRVVDVEIPPQDRDDVEIGHDSLQEATFTKTTADSGDYRDWGKIRHSYPGNVYGAGSTTSLNFPYALDGTGVDVVIQDSGIQVDHPEFEISSFVAPDHYAAGPLVTDSTNGAVFDRSINVHGLKIVVAGAVGGATTVHSEFAKKVARTVELLLTPRRTTNTEKQKKLIENLRGGTGTWHAGTPTAQRIGYGGGASYSPNWLLDAGIPSYSGYQGFLDSHAVNDMVWYLNSGGTPGTGNNDITEVIEHVFHTIHQYGLEARELKMFPSFDSDWATGPMFLAMKEAEDNSIFDPSGYAPNWKTDADTFPVAVKEYLYLLNFAMFEYTSLWDGGSLSPEWANSARTPAGVQANNPLGYGLFNTHIKDVIEKIDIDVLQSIFPDGDTGNPFAAGASGYVSNTSNSRVQLLDWGQYSGSVTQSANHYRDYDGHGTHCAGTAVGLNYGWGKNARIYSQKLSGLEGSGDSGTGISITYAFDVITAWHNAKPIDPITGVKRPTIVNMSWGYSSGYTPSNVSAFSYRGVTYNSGNDSNLLNAANQLSAYGFYQYLTSGGYRVPLRVSSVDTNIQEMIDAGIHVCVAAGNNRFKADLSGGLDYNNTVSTPTVRSYHRGSSPTDDEAISVGSLGYAVGSLTEETKSLFSTTGPGVDIYAAGEYIISATSTTNKFSAPSYYGNASFKQTNISGTSMASPQVCGLGALHLQANPHWTPAQLKDRLIKDTEARLQDGGLTAYSTHTNIMGGNNRIMLSRYANAVPFSSNVAGLKKR